LGSLLELENVMTPFPRHVSGVGVAVKLKPKTIVVHNINNVKRKLIFVFINIYFKANGNLAK
jgi:hypothetical protein